MELTLEQENALKILVDRYKNKELFSVLSGWAGTGKTTCIRALVEYLLNDGLKEDDVVFTAYTGKAVQVMIEKGNKNAMTLHKLLYESRPLPNGTFKNTPKKLGEIPFKIIVCDEVSMVTKDLIDLLLNHNIHTIFIGDDAQLPPINKKLDNHLLLNPDAVLTTIHRQAAESGILRLSKLIREGESFENFKSDDALVFPREKLNEGMLQWADQILCATNNTRIALNKRLREMKGYSENEKVVNGEKLICCSNYWDVMSENDNFLTNGVIGYASNPNPDKVKIPAMYNVSGNSVPIVEMDFASEDNDQFGRFQCDEKFLLSGNTYLSPEQKYAIGKSKRYRTLIPYEFTYAYAITTWKAQGSQFGKVLGMEETFPFNKEEHKKFLYTMVTRATDKLVLITAEE